VSLPCTVGTLLSQVIPADPDFDYSETLIFTEITALVPYTWGYRKEGSSYRKDSVQVFKVSVHVRKDSVQVFKVSVHVRKDSVQVFKVSVHVRKDSVQVFKVSVHVRKNSVQVFKVSVHVRKDSIQLAGHTV